MKRKKILWIFLAVFVVLAAAVVIIINPFSETTQNAQGSMNIICPIHAYQVGEQFKCPCPLRPQEQCNFVDANNCQYFFKNVGDDFIPKGSPVEVTKQKIQGVVQYVEVRIPL
jgi:hypothetical protein